MEEIWKPVKKYEGYYEVSNLGEVKSIDRYVGKSKIFKKGVLMTQQIDKGGYYKVVLRKQGKSRTKMTSRLVAEALYLIQTICLLLITKTKLKVITRLKILSGVLANTIIIMEQEMKEQD